MNHDQPITDEQERQMFEHYRLHSGGEPSAQLDAQILAAANAAVLHKTTSQPGLSTRLQSWLFGSGGRQRWSVVLAGVACLGIGVSLTWRSIEQAPDAFDAVPSGLPIAPVLGKMAPQSAPLPAPLAESAVPAEQVARSPAVQSAPIAQGYSADTSNVEKKRSAIASSQPLGEAVVADALQPPQPQAARTQAPQALSKAAEPIANQTEQRVRSELQRLLKLRADGWTDEADAVFLQLMREYPDLDIEAQLQQLQQAE